jgi:glycosyltransferase involved in cell wall biosynthesis
MLKKSISFVIPAYNCFTTIVESVESILNNNFYEGDEIIIVNDCSTDNTSEVLGEIKKEYPFIIIINNGKNKGCPASRNVGIKVAKNSLIFNLDSDDVLFSGSVKKLRDYMILYNADMAAFGSMYFFKKNIKNITHKWIFKEGIFTLADFLSGPIVPGGNYLYTKKSWERIGGYWEYGKGLHEFWGFTLKQLACGAKFAIMPNSFYYHRHGTGRSLFIEESKITNGNFLTTKMIKPFLYLIENEDVKYIMSREGRMSWFSNLYKIPIRVKGEKKGRTGIVIYSKKEKLKLYLKSIIGKVYKKN